MIRLDSISKHNGQRLVFIEASAALQKGRRSGWSAPMARARPRYSA